MSRPRRETQNVPPRGFLLPSNFVDDPDKLIRKRNQPAKHAEHSKSEFIHNNPTRSKSEFDQNSPCVYSLDIVLIEEFLHEQPECTVKFPSTKSSHKFKGYIAKFSLETVLGAHSNLLHLSEIEFSLNYQHSTYLLFEKGKGAEAIIEVQVGADRSQVVDFTHESLDHQKSAASLFEVRVKINRLILFNALMGLGMDIDFDPQPFIAVPLSSQSESQFYRTNIEPVLLDMLSKLDIDFFFTLAMFNLPISNSETISGPVIIVYTTCQDNVTIIHSSLVRIWNNNPAFRSYIVHISLGDCTMTTASPSSGLAPYQDIQSHWKCGISIGYLKESATAGPILEDRDGNFYFLTVAHLFDDSQNCLGLRVTQPSFEDYLELVNDAQIVQRACQRDFNRMEGVLKEEASVRLETVTAQLDQLLARPHDTAEAFHASAMSVASVVKSAYGRTSFNGRPCLLDYALCKLESRMPKYGERFYDPRPKSGYLKSLDWALDASYTGPLMWDKYVKKRGRSSGVTYGIVAGVHSVMRHSDTGVRREYWVLPEAKKNTLWEFGEHGDSGSLVWTTDGEAVGMVIAGWTSMFEKPPIHMIITPEYVWDVKNIPLYRQIDGSLNFDELLTAAVTRPLTLIESLDMVLNDISMELKLWSS